MPRPVFDKGDEALGFIHEPENSFHDVQVGVFVFGADVINLSRLSFLQNQVQGAAVVFDVNPVPDVLAVAVDGDGFTGQGVQDDGRDELLRVLVGAVVVAAAGDDHRQAVGDEVGPAQEVGGGFAGRVGAVGPDGTFFGKGRVVRLKRTVDLIGGYLEEFPDAVLPGGLQQHLGALDVGLDKGCRVQDAAIHVGLGGQVGDEVEFFLPEKTVDQLPVGYVAADKAVAGVILYVLQVFQVAGIGKLV